MAASAPDYYEIRWRVKNSGAAWSAPQRVHPCDEVVVEELDRTQLYEFEARAVSACGAKSVWVPSDYTVPGENAPLSVDTLTAQALADGVHLGWTSIAIPPAGIEYSVERSADGAAGWAERVRVRSTAYTDPETSGTTYYYRVRAVTFSGTFGPYSPVASSAGVSVSDLAAEAASAKSDADSALTQAQLANQELAAVANDNVLSPAEKPTVMRDYSVITAEQPGIDAQAAAYGIAAEKTAYDNAVTALTDYLATLTADTAWNDKSGNTTIVGATFRSNFNTVYTTRQTLLNAIYAAAKSKADAAQATANQATAAVTNPQFANGLNGWNQLNTGWYEEAAGSGHQPDPVVPTYCVHAGSSVMAGALATDVLPNDAHMPVVPGQQVTLACCVREISVNAGALAFARISWRDWNNSELSTSAPNGTVQYPNCGAAGTGTYEQCVTKITATAPPNAQFAMAQLEVSGHTDGYFTFCNVVMGIVPSSIDEVPDGANHVRSIAVSTSETVDNANFELAANADGSIPGWKAFGSGGSITLQNSTAGPYAGNQSLLVLGGTGATNFGAETSRHYACSPGDKIVASAALYTGAGALSYLQIRYYNASGGVTGSNQVAQTAFNSWQVVTVNGTVPAGTSYFTLLAFNPNTNGGNLTIDAVRLSRVRSLDTEIQDGSTYARIYGSELSNGQHRIGVPGSGYQLGDQRNMPYVSWGNYGGGWSGMSVIYNTTTTSCTFNASAASYVGGGVSIPYNAGSVSVSGSAGSTVTYYLFYDDPSMTGGSKTLQATTNQITSLNAGGRVLVGTVKVTYPTSGTGSGTGSGGCPDENAWVLRADPEGIRCDWTVRAKDIEVGHYLRLSDGRAGRVTYSQRKASPRVRVTSSDGHTLTCSPSAPLELAAGGHGDCILARSSLWAIVRILCPVPVLATQIANVEQMADGHVQHITCENACFWTGDDPDYLFAHHNLKPGGP